MPQPKNCIRLPDWSLIALLHLLILPLLPHPCQALPQEPENPIIAAVLNDFPPLYTLDATGQPDGFAIDILRNVASKAGIEVHYLVVENWGEAMEAVRTGKADLIPGIGISPVRSDEFSFTELIETIPVSCFVRSKNYDIKGVEDLPGTKVAVIRQSAAETKLRLHQGVNLTPFDNIDSALIHLLSGEVDAFVFPEPVLKKKARMIGLEKKIKVVGKPLMELKRGFLLKKTNSALLARLNPAIASYAHSEEYLKSYSFWYGAPAPFWTVRKVAWSMSGLLFGTICLLVFWKYQATIELNQRLNDYVNELEETKFELTGYRDQLEELVKERTAELSKANQDLVDSEERYRNLSEAAFEGICIIERGMILEANNTMAAMFKYQPQELIGMAATDLVKATEGDKVHNKIATAAIGRYETVCQRKDGSTFAAEVHARQFVYKGRQVRGTGVRDISEQKKAEESITKAALEWSTAMDASEDAIYLLDTNRHILRANKVFHLLTDSTPQNTIGRHIEEIIHPQGETVPCPVCKAQQKMLDAEIIMEADHPDNPADRPILVTVKIVRSPKGEPISILMNLHDLTKQRAIENELRKHRDHLEELVRLRTEELKETHNQLVHVEKLSAIGKLAASIAHEFNNPLQGVSNVIKRVTKKEELDDNNKELMEMAVKECDRMKFLIKDLQDFNRPSSGTMAPTDVHTTIDSITLMAKKDLKHHSISLEKDYDPEMPKIPAVADQLKQVFLNLLNNAIDACEGGGTIRISTSVSNTEGYIHFKDNGKGIKDEDAKHIFEPFFTTKQAIKGTGLGLPVSYGIIKKHGGRIKVESTPEHGTTFTVTLPIRERAHEEVPAPG